MDEIVVEVAWREGSRVRVESCRLPAGATVADALQVVGAPREAAVGIFGRVVEADTVLCCADRVEVYEALPNDPKLARRERARQARRR
ncbi:MAG: RnfH family protein [Steroidobacteraceae bacterium]|nr:RnfH family protein [Pseudomonadota bacterium]